MKYEDWPESTKVQLSLDFDLFLKKLSSKYGAPTSRVDLDLEGAFAFKVEDRIEESNEERNKRMEKAEYYLRAWLALTGHPARPPSESWSLFDQDVEVRFLDPIGGEETLKYVGKVVDVDYAVFPRDPLIVLHNSAPRPKVENPRRPYVELVECYASQVVSWSAKASRAKLVKGNGKVIDFPTKVADEKDDLDPDAS